MYEIHKVHVPCLIYTLIFLQQVQVFDCLEPYEPKTECLVRITDKCTQASDNTELDNIEFRLPLDSLFPSVYKFNYSNFHLKIFS
jgi:hypothetical protein